jgi:hypothetical protein
MGAKSAGTGVSPVLSCLDALNLEETSKARVAVSPFLTGKITKGEPLLGYGSRMGNPSDPTPQVEHLFKTDGRDKSITSPSFIVNFSFLATNLYLSINNLSRKSP